MPPLVCRRHMSKANGIHMLSTLFIWWCFLCFLAIFRFRIFKIRYISLCMTNYLQCSNYHLFSQKSRRRLGRKNIKRLFNDQKMQKHVAQMMKEDWITNINCLILNEWMKFIIPRSNFKVPNCYWVQGI